MLLNILLTGAAGLVGGEVADRLIKAGHRVTAMVRQSRDIRANDGSEVEPARVVSGDVTKDWLGMAQADYAASASECDMVIHCAASVRFDLDDAAYHATNVAGTARVIELAKAGNMAMLHVSTAYVCGGRDGAILESDPLPETGFANGYEASKAAAEKLVRGSGLRFAITRPSIITGHSETGAIRSFDTTYALFRLMAQGRIAHIPASPNASFDFVPIDHVAAGIVSLAEGMDEAAGQTFHLCADAPLSVADFLDAIASYPHFEAPETMAPQRFDPASLPTRERRLFARAVKPYASYFARDPHFDDGAFQAATGFGCPPTGSDYFKRLIDYCIAEGFLGERTPQRISG